MPKPQPNKITEQTDSEKRRADTAVRTGCDMKWEERKERRGEAGRAKASVAAAAALASSASGRGSASSMPPPLKAPPAGKPPPPDLQGSGRPIKAVPTSKPHPPSPSTLGPSPSGVQEPGARLYARGPHLGGAFIPESTAGSAFTAFHVPVGPVGKSIMMRRAADKDRKLQSFPRAAFKYLPEEDPPILGVLAGPSVAKRAVERKVVSTGKRTPGLRLCAPRQHKDASCRETFYAGAG